ncbi:hypothetical protein HW555_008298 [Spodoptera exigua]|uniref:Gustatory receptor n=1 Tax=Spodoptera exigua TaxID=7107 RepID=A0A835GD88_SPOEX|nr:hypothetical protein HW555_008298 [Spodoptera exigua]
MALMRSLIEHKRSILEWLQAYLICITEGLMDLTLSFAPAFLAELVKASVDRLKLIVTTQLLHCKEETTSEAIEDAMMFFRHHPFKYTVWRLFTVDGTLIVGIVNALTVYTVALVQFSHLFQ